MSAPPGDLSLRPLLRSAMLHLPQHARTTGGQGLHAPPPVCKRGSWTGDRGWKDGRPAVARGRAGACFIRRRRFVASFGDGALLEATSVAASFGGGDCYIQPRRLLHSAAARRRRLLRSVTVAASFDGDSCYIQLRHLLRLAMELCYRRRRPLLHSAAATASFGGDGCYVRRWCLLRSRRRLLQGGVGGCFIRRRRRCCYHRKRRCYWPMDAERCGTRG